MYLVRGVLIDTGFPGIAAEVRALLEQHRIRGAIITHHHEDHAGNLAALAEAGIPVQATPHTLDYTARRHQLRLYREFAWQAAAPVAQPLEPFTDDTFEFLLTPGHTADHHAVWDTRTGTLYAGDLYLGARVRIAQPDEQPRRLLQSLRAMAAREPARIFCAHRGLLPHGHAQLTAKADWLEQLIHAVDRRLAEGWSDDAIRREVLGARPPLHWLSRGEYSPDNLVKALRASL
jgi:glyoxylase-like metal-dependent hydrolase (beta-lactamase superfamily II)